MLPKTNCISYIFASDSIDHIIRWRPEQFGDDGELIDVIFSWKQWLALEHFCEDTASAPDVNFNIVLLPREHNLGCSIISRRDITCHLRILNPSKPKIANLKIAVFVHQDVARLQVSMYNARGMNIFEATLGLVSAAAGIRAWVLLQESGTKSTV